MQLTHSGQFLRTIGGKIVPHETSLVLIDRNTDESIEISAEQFLISWAEQTDSKFGEFFFPFPGSSSPVVLPTYQDQQNCYKCLFVLRKHECLRILNSCS